MQGLSSGMTALVHSETASLISVLLTFLTHSYLQVWLAPTKGVGVFLFLLTLTLCHWTVLRRRLLLSVN